MSNRGFCIAYLSTIYQLDKLCEKEYTSIRGNEEPTNKYMQKKITLATIKKFIRDNDELYIKKNYEFDGMIDGTRMLNEDFKPVTFVDNVTNHNLGISGAWFVGSSRDYFTKFENDEYEGYQISNACGCFIIAKSTKHEDDCVCLQCVRDRKNEDDHYADYVATEMAALKRQGY